MNDGISLKKVSNTNGGEFAGSCPFCGGRDRFRVWPEYKGGRWWCRQCGKSGDAIDYLREFKGMTYGEAARLTGKEMVKSKTEKHPVKIKDKFTPKVSLAPNQIWQNRAKEYLEAFQETLRPEQGQSALDFLHSRGLQDETIKAAGLGVNTVDRYRDRESWGLPSEVKDNGRPKKLWIPSGLIIPFFDRAGSILRLRVRRFNSKDGNRYVIVPGSDLRPMVFNPEAATAIVVESELDAILLHQEIGGDWCCIVAMGSATAKPDNDTNEMLKKMQTILVSLDSDAAGAGAAWSWWPETYTTAKRWPTIRGKDPSEAYQQGLNLRAWVMAGLDLTSDRLERFCLQTVDGNLSDREALKNIDINA